MSEDKIDEQTKVKFSVSIGLVGCEIDDEFTLYELGYDPNVHNLNKFLEEEWKEWSQNYIDGYWDLKE